MSIILCEIMLAHACHRRTLERKESKDSLQGPQFKVDIQLQTPTMMAASTHTGQNSINGGGAIFADVVDTGADPEFQSRPGQSSTPGLSW